MSEQLYMLRVLIKMVSLVDINFLLLMTNFDQTPSPNFLLLMTNFDQTPST